MFDQKMYNQIMDFQKASFDNTFTAVAKMQEQGDAMLNVFLNQASWLPEEGRKTIKEWTRGFQTARDDFQKIITENFKSVEKYTQAFTEPVKSASKAK